MVLLERQLRMHVQIERMVDEGGGPGLIFEAPCGKLPGRTGKQHGKPELGQSVSQPKLEL